MPKYKTLKKIKEIDVKDNALEIFLRRYALRNKDGKPCENLEQGFERVASHIANGEKTTTLKKTYTELFYRLLASKRFIPNAPTWTGSRTKLGQLAACFVLPISDDMGRDQEGIFQSLRNAALIQQSGGGNGFSFSSLRPKGDRISSSNGIASGPISFMEIYDSAFGKIAQGGARRGANMAVLRVDHPDIMEFIKCKSEEGKIANFNISVGITDKFMEAVKKDGDFELINPRDKSIWKKVKAREIFDDIVKYSYKNGEPGVLFLDTANKFNPVPNQYTLEATNPCGEQWLGGYENCCLGHINLKEHINEGKVDWRALEESVTLGVRFLDNVVTQNNYIPSVPQLKEAAIKNRRIGLGIMGLADAFYKMGIRYGSKESLDFASQIMEFVQFHAIKTSVELAKERDPFPGISGSTYDKKSFRWQKPQSLVNYELETHRPLLDWNSLEKSIKKCGVRNAAQLTIAPTGSTATVFGVEGYGCEPVFALAYFRNVYQAAGGNENLRLRYVSPSFQEALDISSLTKEQKEEIVKEATEKGTIQKLKNLPEKIKNTFVVSGDITAEEHVMMQAVLQRFVDNSISKTCNFPENATEKDIGETYFRAWELGCKGLTVYVTGSRKEVVLETKETAEKRQITPSSTIRENEVRPRPNIVVGRTHKIATPVGKAFVTVNRDGETGSAPFEVFINIGKSGSDLSSMAEALGRLISGWLRSAKNPNTALDEIVQQLRGIGGSSSIGFGPNRISSLPDAVSKVLSKEIALSFKLEENKDIKTSELKENETVEVSTQPSLLGAAICPECNNISLVETEGCVKCMSCSYTRC